jgi:putative DNA primase/helicase
MNGELTDVTLDPTTDAPDFPAGNSEDPTDHPDTPDTTVDDPDTRPQICVALKQLPEAVAAAQQALAAYNDPPFLFEHNGELVKLVAADGQAPRLLPMRTADVQCELAYAARWFEQTEKGPKPIYPPAMVVHALVHRIGGCVPTLRQVVQVPTFGTNWQLLDEPGYHAADQVYYHPDHEPLPPISQKPDCDEVAEARRLICDELLGDFPFAGPADRAAAIAAVVLPFVRGRIDGATPLHLFDSPQPGSGKTLLADAVAIPALGKEPAATTEVANADDLRKWVTAMAVAGEPVVLIDNVNARLGGAALAAALTKVEWSDRVVGTSRLAKAGMRCLWLATGNNVAMTTELARRVVRCRIDAGVPRPHLRSGFRHGDLRGWAKDNRPQLIWAALTLVQNWLAQGRPPGPVTLGSYEGYARVVGGILMAAAIDGFLANVGDDQRHADDEAAEWEAFVEAWRELRGVTVVRAGDLDDIILTPNPEMLSLALAGTNTERGRRVKLGQELRKRRDAVIAGCRVRVSDRMDRHGCWHYRLEVVA